MTNDRPRLRWTGGDSRSSVWFGLAKLMMHDKYLRVEAIRKSRRERARTAVPEAEETDTACHNGEDGDGDDDQDDPPPDVDGEKDHESSVHQLFSNKSQHPDGATIEGLANSARLDEADRSTQDRVGSQRDGSVHSISTRRSGAGTLNGRRQESSSMIYPPEENGSMHSVGGRYTPSHCRPNNQSLKPAMSSPTAISSTLAQDSYAAAEQAQFQHSEPLQGICEPPTPAASTAMHYYHAPAQQPVYSTVDLPCYQMSYEPEVKRGSAQPEECQPHEQPVYSSRHYLYVTQGQPHHDHLHTHLQPMYKWAQQYSPPQPPHDAAPSNDPIHLSQEYYYQG